MVTGAAEPPFTNKDRKSSHRETVRGTEMRIEQNVERAEEDV